MAKDSNLYGALAYVLGLVTGVVMLLVAPKDKYVKFHAMQSILFCVGVFVIQFVIGIISIPLTIMTLGFGAILFFLIYAVVGLAALIAWLLLMYKAYNGEKYKLPIIGEYAEKLAKN